MKNNLFIGFLSIIILFSFGYSFSNVAQGNYAAAFFALGTSVRSLIEKYATATNENGSKIKILIVAGHEPTTGGAEYANLKERDMNLKLSTELKTLLEKNPRFQVVMFRDKYGFNRDFTKYLNNNKDAILSWRAEKKAEMNRLVNEGKVTLIGDGDKVQHADAKSKVVTYLYGLNKWTSENKFDIAIHIHFNDNPGERKYEGFTIYVPEKQYSNSTSSKVLAQNIFDELKRVEPVSTLPGENNGITEDQDLIAIGPYNTSDTLSVLIEYGYIYEPKMQYSGTRNAYIYQAASSTAKSINDFFNSRALFLN